MLGLDIFLMSLPSFEQKEILKKVRRIAPCQPLLCWDIYAYSTSCMLQKINNTNDLKKLLDLQKKYQWKTEVEKLAELDYEALILTDLTQTIKWVSSGFEGMTGYSGKFAIGKKPSFLQGINTQEETKSRIREKLAYGKPFSESIINYRKDKKEYLCEVTIIPLFNKADRLTHFLALEKELKTGQQKPNITHYSTP